jgi:hypothetical protein
MRLLATVAAVTLLGVAGLGAASGARAADDWAMGADLRCVSAFAFLISNPQYKDNATIGLFYYLGRIDGRDPTYDLAKGLAQVRSSVQGQIASESQRCGAEIKAKNEALKAISGQTQPPKRGVG